ncbi:hypothetical protein PPL_05505 [Heterostelium album PN500]|uniref:Uncharacterized protein n=1 Tax=Heterostelium pallidum (strain ATCC 26659 / Pp 5 / PN500) TaxID=670386 RepID=D3BAC9_HETP5|nr:hypothetical protein PPL_05505 [Heterostelium album PN500]EFA81516.1 hypothetical protein PPL_05505 [Heterostelium album PN500]|eukprot:XP_020433633.1 hypothetical protein PPL_05505 [Heterostelium album PN500]
MNIKINVLALFFIALCFFGVVLSQPCPHGYPRCNGICENPWMGPCNVEYQCPEGLVLCKETLSCVMKTHPCATAYKSLIEN